MTRILMVHGRAQQGRSAEAVRDEWLRSLRLGLGAQAPVLDDVQVDVPFYGDHLDELMRQLGSTIPEDLLARGDVVGAEDDFLRFQAEIFDEVRRREDVTDDQVAAEMDGVVERGPLNWFWVRAIMKTLNRVPGSTET